MDAEPVKLSDRGDVGAASRDEALVGAMICGVFGVAWTQWGASGISGAASGAIRIAGIAVGLGIFILSARLRREHPPAPGPTGPVLTPSRSVFSSPVYRRVVVLEVIGLLGGVMVLGMIGHPEYIAGWFATVVGAHFIAFGRLIDMRFYWLGMALIAAGSAAASVGLAGGGEHGVEAVAGLMSAASLLVAGGWTVAKARWSRPPSRAASSPRTPT